MTNAQTLLTHIQDMIRLMREYIPDGQLMPGEEDILTDFLVEGMDVLDNYIADPDAEPGHIREIYDRLDRYRSGP